MKASKFLFLFLSLCLLFGFTGCMEDGGNRQSFPEQAAVVTSDYLYGKKIVTFAGEFYAPALDDISDILDGDCLITNFTLDYDNQPSGASFYTVQVTGYYKATKGNLLISKASVDSYYNDSTITQAAPYSYLLKNMLFFPIIYKGKPGKKAEYELFCNTDSVDENGYPTLYLNSRIVNSGDGTTNQYYDFAAFDMRAFVMTYPADSNKKIYYNFKYQTGIDKEGKPIYKSFTQNPCYLVKPES